MQSVTSAARPIFLAASQDRRLSPGSFGVCSGHGNGHRESDNKCSRRRQKKGKNLDRPTGTSTSESPDASDRPQRAVTSQSAPLSPSPLGRTHTFAHGFLPPAGRFPPRPHPKPRARGLNPTFSAGGGMFTHLAGLNPRRTHTGGTRR